MGSNFWWLYDIAVIIIAVISITYCAKRGFSKIIISAIGCVISFIIAWGSSGALSGFVYEKMFMQSNIEAVEKAIEDYRPEDIVKAIIESNELSGVLSNDTIKSILNGENSLDNLYDYANSEASNILDTKENFKKQIINEFAKAFSSQVGTSLPPYVSEAILNNIENNEKLFIETVDMLLNNPEHLPIFIEQNYIREPAERIVSSSLFIIIFAALMTIVIFVASRSWDFGLLNGYDRLDKFTGGIMGIVEGIALVMIMAFIVKIIINMSDSGNSFVCVETIDKTLLFKHFYKFL